MGIKARGGIAIVIAHRPSGIAAADMLGVMAKGMLTAFGPRDAVLQKVAEAQKAQRGAAAPVQQVWPTSYKSSIRGMSLPAKKGGGNS